MKVVGCVPLLFVCLAIMGSTPVAAEDECPDTYRSFLSDPFAISDISSSYSVRFATKQANENLYNEWWDFVRDVLWGEAVCENSANCVPTVIETEDLSFKTELGFGPVSALMARLVPPLAHHGSFTNANTTHDQECYEKSKVISGSTSQHYTSSPIIYTTDLPAEVEALIFADVADEAKEFCGDSCAIENIHVHSSTIAVSSTWIPPGVNVSVDYSVLVDCQGEGEGRDDWGTYSSISFRIQCEARPAGHCGNGSTEWHLGEDCEGVGSSCLTLGTARKGTCNAECQCIPHSGCGNLVVDHAAGEECDPPGAWAQCGGATVPTTGGGCAFVAIKCGQDCLCEKPPIQVCIPEPNNSVQSVFVD